MSPHPTQQPAVRCAPERDPADELNRAEEVLDALAVDLNLPETAFDCLGDYITAVAVALRASTPEPEQVEDTESACYAVEAIWQFCPELKPREDNMVLLTAAQCEVILRRMGWVPPSEWKQQEMCKSTQKRLAVQREQCGETCERAKLCATCAQPITAPTGSPLRTSFDAWWDHGHDWGGSLQAACLSAFKAGAASVLKGGAL